MPRTCRRGAAASNRFPPAPYGKPAPSSRRSSRSFSGPRLRRPRGTSRPCRSRIARPSRRGLRNQDMEVRPGHRPGCDEDAHHRITARHFSTGFFKENPPPSRPVEGPSGLLYALPPRRRHPSPAPEGRTLIRDAIPITGSIRCLPLHPPRVDRLRLAVRGGRESPDSRNANALGFYQPRRGVA